MLPFAHLLVPHSLHLQFFSHQGKPERTDGGGHALVCTAALTDYLSRIVKVSPRVRLTAM